jgi:hypothetical protein
MRNRVTRELQNWITGIFDLIPAEFCATNYQKNRINERIWTLQLMGQSTI